MHCCLFHVIVAITPASTTTTLADTTSPSGATQVQQAPGLTTQTVAVKSSPVVSTVQTVGQTTPSASVMTPSAIVSEPVMQLVQPAVVKVHTYTHTQTTHTPHTHTNAPDSTCGCPWCVKLLSLLVLLCNGAGQAWHQEAGGHDYSTCRSSFLSTARRSKRRESTRKVKRPKMDLPGENSGLAPVRLT